MATTAQITANRANAQQSTGPNTPAGIENCKHNATRHGLTGKQVVIKGEDPAEYDALRAALIEQHQPASEQEAMLVEQIAQNWWRLQRAKKAEAQVLERYGLLECMTEPEAHQAFQTVTRYLTTIERAWNRAVRDLQNLQKARAESAPEVAQSPEPKIGSVSQKPTLVPTGARSQESEGKIANPARVQAPDFNS